ncbi:EF-hand domain-containing protein [Croceibacterium sp. TMG7-5b_MA50]|uniref:EF-hand domain-containing protein n=1 Tax=Croceibacterium sp. TMG7-5b_MA50 TaxID=3121290 RepID=UPI0032215C43
MSLLAFGSAAAALLAMPAVAQNAAPDPQSTLQNNRMRMMADTTRQQAEQRATELFTRMDSDGDGQLSAEEASRMPARGRRAQEGRLRGPVPDVAPPPATGSEEARPMTRADFVANALALFDRADADRNGTVTQEERRAARGQRNGRTGGPPTTIQ